MRKLKIIFSFLFIAMISSSLAVVKAEEKIVAVVNKEIITQRDLESFLNFMRVQLSKQFSSKEIEEKIAVMKADLLDRLIEDRLILQEARRKNLQVDETRVKTKIGDLKKRYNSDIEFENSLKTQGLVEADLEAKIREQLLMFNVVETEIRTKVSVKPAEITQYYNKDNSEFNLSEKREFRSLAGIDQEKALKVVQDLREEKDLNEVAKESGFTLNVFSSFKGGELKKEVEDVLFNLKLWEVSEPLKINDNYYVFKLTKITPPRKQALSEVQDSIYSLLYEKKMQEAMVRWIEELKKKAYIKKT